VIRLGLDRLERHSGLAQPGHARVPQLMASQVRETGTVTGALEDLHEACRTQRLPSPRTLEDKADHLRRRLRALLLRYFANVAKNCDDTGTMRWWPPLPSATNRRCPPGLMSESRRPSTSHRHSPQRSMASTMARSRCVRSAATRASLRQAREYDVASFVADFETLRGACGY
jgi:hypothetical protein